MMRIVEIILKEAFSTVEPEEKKIGRVPNSR